MNDARLNHGIGLVGLGAVVWLGWSAAYVPAVHRTHELQQRVLVLRQQVEATESLVQQTGGEAAWIAQQHKRMETLTQRLPSPHTLSKILNRVVGQVTEAHLEVVNVAQGNLEPVKDAQGNMLIMEQAPCQALPVTLTVSGRYQAVVTLLEQIVDAAFPCAVRVEQVHLALADPVSGTLTATIVLRLYVLGT